jgi:hypothetical protein
MSLRPRFSNSPGPHSSSTTTAAANQHNGATTAKDHHHHRRHRLLIFSESRHRLSILFLILLLLTTSSLYFFDDLFANLLDHHDDDDDASRKITSSFVLQARFLRGLLGVGQVQQKGTIRIPPTRQEHPRMVTVDIPESNKNQQKAEAAVVVVVTSASLESPPRRVDGGGGAAMVVLVQPMSTEQILQDSNTNERENKKDLGLADPLETKECKAQYQWQLDSKPTCNALHEMDMRHFVDKKATHGDYSDENVLRERVRLIANGGWRDVWGLIDDYNDHHRSGDIGHSEDAIENDGDESKTNDRYVVLKTLLYPKEVVPRNVERHRRDAMAMERLTSSQNIVDIYAFCGNSGLFEFAKGGDLEAAVHALAKSFYTNGQLTREERLQRLQLGAYTMHPFILRLYTDESPFRVIIAHMRACCSFFIIIDTTGVQGAMGLADLHNFDQEGRPSVAHTDISLGQFVKIDGRFKLNDFNRVRRSN